MKTTATPLRFWTPGHRPGDGDGLPHALVCGCAGLRGTLTGAVTPGPGTLLGFFWGEVVTVRGRPRFGNLMLARLVREA